MRPLQRILSVRQNGEMGPDAVFFVRSQLTQDLFAAGEDGSGIALALRWSSPTTALRYARELAVGSNAAARVLGKLRGAG